MKNNKFTPLMIVHLILVALMLLANLACAVMIFRVGGEFGNVEMLDAEELLLGMTASINIVNILAFGCGLMHLWSRYAKQAAIYYKAFMLLTVVETVLIALLIVRFHLLGVQIVKQFTVFLLIMVLKAVLLLALTFWQNLGRRNTWILFFLLLALDLVMSFLFVDYTAARAYAVVVTLSRLLIDGTIALAILGKYTDKSARGTK